MPAPSVPELRRTLNRQVLKAHAAKVITVFQSWDLDGDGAISKREFRRAVQPLLNLPAGPEALDELFDLFDIDGSGCIGLKQIHDVLRRGQAMEPPPELLQTTVAAPRESRAQVRYELRKMERDGRKNGVRAPRARPWEGINPQVEYDGGVPVQVPVEEQISRALRKQGAHVVEMFRIWDEDGDGEVSRDEFRKAMPVLGVHASRQDVNACFDRWDPDGSGALSLRELDLSVDSAALPLSLPHASVSIQLDRWGRGGRLARRGAWGGEGEPLGRASRERPGGRVDSFQPPKAPFSAPAFPQAPHSPVPALPAPSCTLRRAVCCHASPRGTHPRCDVTRLRNRREVG